VVGQLLDMDLPMPCEATWLMKALNKAESAVVQALAEEYGVPSDGPLGTAAVDSEDTSVRTNGRLRHARIAAAIVEVLRVEPAESRGDRGGQRGHTVVEGGGQAEVNSYKQEYEFQLAHASTIQAITSLAEPMNRFPQTIAYLQKQGTVADPLLTLEELAQLLPGAILGFHRCVKQHEFGLMCIKSAVEGVDDHAARMRYNDVLATLDSSLVEALKSGLVTVALSPLEAAVGFIPAVAVVIALFADTRVAFKGSQLPAVTNLYNTAAQLTFMDEGQIPPALVLRPAVALFKQAWDAVMVAAARGPSLESMINVKKVCDSLAGALGAACSAGLDYKTRSVQGGSFREHSLGFIRGLQQRQQGDPNAVIPLEVLETIMDTLQQLSLSQQQDAADLASLSGERGEAHLLAVSALRARIEAGIASVSVNAVKASSCTFTPGCGGVVRYGDPFCEECRKWSPRAWVCPECKRVGVNGPKCFDYYCGGVRPGGVGGALPASAVPGAAHVARQKAAYARRAEHEAEMAAKRSSS
jgi:hypothetical protein